MINLVNFLGCIDDVSTEFSSTLNFEIHKVELLKQFIDNQIKLDDISYEYILEILDEIFNYEASNYNLSLGEILIDDNSVSLNYFEENINIFGNFNLSLNVEGILNDIDTDLFIEEDYNEREESKIIAIEIEFCCKVEYKLDENHNIKRDAAIGKFFLLNILNKEIIPIMPDNIDIYELYDLKLYSEYNFNDEIYYKMSNPRYRKLVEDIEFISYEDLRLE